MNAVIGCHAYCRVDDWHKARGYKRTEWRAKQFNPHLKHIGYGSYNRGRLQQHLELAEDMPYWEYQHNDNAHPRLEHMAWDGLVLRYDDPWWRYHYPVKAYGCHCTVIAHDDMDLDHYGKKLGTAPPVEMEQKTVGIRSGNPRTVTIPKGTDVGFTPHNFENIKAGRNASIDSVLMQKLVTAEPKFASLLVENILQRPQAVAMLNLAMKDMVDNWEVFDAYHCITINASASYSGRYEDNLVYKFD